MSTEQQQIEASIEEVREHISLAEALQRLHENKDFKKIILEGYFEKNAQRAVMLKSDINTQTKDEQRQIDNVITGIGQLGQYFHKIFVFGERASMDLKEHLETQEEILAEEANSSGLDDLVVN